MTDMEIFIDRIADMRVEQMNLILEATRQTVINSHALAGAAVLLTEKTVFDREFWEFASAEKATSLAGVPYTYEMLKKLKFMEMELPNLKTMTQAGGKLSVSLHREFAEYAAGHGKRFIVMYGQTEALQGWATFRPAKL